MYLFTFPLTSKYSCLGHISWHGRLYHLYMARTLHCAMYNGKNYTNSVEPDYIPASRRTDVWQWLHAWYLSMARALEKRELHGFIV
jgi:hypothetical protein